MGTRSLTRVIPRQEGLAYNQGHLHPEKAVTNMYRQFDGYPEGHGLELAEFLKDIKIVNGIGTDQRKLSKYANGEGCLAAQMVKHFKNDLGYIYLELCEGEPGDYGDEYIYTLFPKAGEPTYIAIYDTVYKKCIFVGTPHELIEKYTSEEVHV